MSGARHRTSACSRHRFPGIRGHPARRWQAGRTVNGPWGGTSVVKKNLRGDSRRGALRFGAGTATRDVTERTAARIQAGGTGERGAGEDAAAAFERLYRANVEAVTSYFARRTADPHVVADLTADTFVTVITSFGSFDPAKGTARAWLFGIARHVYAAHCEAYGQHQDRLQRLAGRRDLGPDQ